MGNLDFVWDRRAADCLAEGDFSRAIEILNSQAEVGIALRRMLADMLGKKGSPCHTALLIHRRSKNTIKGRIKKTKSEFYRDLDLALDVEAARNDAAMRGQKMTVRCAREKVAEENRIGFKTVEKAHQTHLRERNTNY